MRWDSLFADLEGQLEAEQAADLAAEVAERTRAERAAVRFADRLSARGPGSLTWYFTDGERLDGTMADVGADWVLIASAAGQVLAPLHALTGVAGLSGPGIPGGPARPARRLTLGVVLRGLARDRMSVRLHLAGGETLTGTLDRVWGDHADLAVHPAGEPRRREAVRAVRSIRFGAMLRLQAAP